MTCRGPTRRRTPATGFEVHAARGPFNAAFFSGMGPYIEWNVRRHKRRVFAELPETVVELGSGVGANLRYLRPGSTLVAIEPNVHMHRRLRAAAERRAYTSTSATASPSTPACRTRAPTR